MKTFSKLTIAAGLATMAATNGIAQNFGEACGCPPLNARTAVTLNNTSSPALVDGNNEFVGPVTTLTCNNIYTANTKLYVSANRDLVIEPGTVIKWVDNSGINANALIVSRDGQIFANGTESCPIIMTSVADPLDGSYAVTNRGRWGGVIILGKAFNNVRSTDLRDGGPNASTSITGTDGVALIEGLSAGDPRHFYGATIGNEVNNDNSGILRYVSLRHGGELLGTANEINGLTMGSVGSGTIIENIEVTSNLDDAFEWFGGSVNGRYLVAMHCDDDYIDYDQGYTGKIQFFYGLQGPDNTVGPTAQGDNGMECDGDDGPGNTAAKSNPTIYNSTIINRILPGTDEGIEARREVRGTIVNSIYANLARGLNMSTDAAASWNAGNFNVRNCTFQGVTTPLRINNVAGAGADLTKFTTTDGNLSVADGSLIDGSYGISPLTSNNVTGRVNPVPAAGQAASTLSPPNDGFFAPVKYRGAFEPGAASWVPRYAVSKQIGTDKSTFSCQGDLNGDFVINATDFSTFVGRFGNSCN